MVQASAKTSRNGSGPAQPTSWWQWLILYPALAIAVLTAVPDWLEIGKSFWYEFPKDELAEALQQKENWEENKSCVSIPADYLSTPNNTKVDATICRKGDIFVQAVTPTGKQRFYWVDVEKIIGDDQSSLATLGIVGAAHAHPPSPTVEWKREDGIVRVQDSVMCQRFLDGRMLLRVISVDGACYDEVIDTFTGTLQTRTPSECRSSC